MPIYNAYQKNFFIILLFTVFSIPTFAGNGTGVDSILELAGIEKPDDWQKWRENKKHKWLQEQGIYPERGRKYKGDFDIDRYFEFLGTQKPSDWNTKSFNERKIFIESIKNNSTLGTQKTTSETSVSSNNSKSQNTSSNSLSSNKNTTSGIESSNNKEFGGVIIIGGFILLIIIGVGIFIFKSRKNNNDEKIS